MTRKKRTPEENARREKIRELLQLANIGSMDDIQDLFKDFSKKFFLTINCNALLKGNQNQGNFLLNS